MKVCRETNRKVIKVPIESRAGIGSSMREQKTGRTTRVCPKATGITKRPPDLECCQGKTLLPQSKIKLQLFPVNEVTRIRLEKVGHHPYLELILRPQKKITSVLKHLNDKWGSSSVALNELVLFPYKMHDSMSSNRRWTLNDGDISAGAVYAAIGCPAVFRLRYGWLSTEPKGADQPSTSANDLQSEVKQRCRSAATENVYDELGKHTVLATKDFRSINARETINADTENISTGVVDLKDDIRRRMGNHTREPLLLDSVTNISIGGLLSEASLQAKCNNNEEKQIGKNEGFHPTETKNDSKSFALWDCPSISIGGLLSEASMQGKLDQFYAQPVESNAGLPHPQGQRPTTHDSCLSIFDAEETCHAFPSQKLSLPGKDVLGFGGSRGGLNQNPGSKLFKFPNAAKSNNVDGLLQDQRACQESNTALMICSRVNNDDRSLGLSGIKWTDSLGPFDLGLPVSQKLIAGESTSSISGFVK